MRSLDWRFNSGHVVPIQNIFCAIQHPMVTSFAFLIGSSAVHFLQSVGFVRVEVEKLKMVLFTYVFMTVASFACDFVGRQFREKLQGSQASETNHEVILLLSIEQIYYFDR